MLACSFRRSDAKRLPPELRGLSSQTTMLFPVGPVALLRALRFGLAEFGEMKPLLRRIFLEGNEPVPERLKALVHTLLGAHLARTLAGRGIDHLHVHHGYFASWAGLVAARLLKINFSLTLHGSDLLIRKAWLDVKLAECEFCLTISDYNRARILETYKTDAAKVIVQHLGVEIPRLHAEAIHHGEALRILSVGRLHPVKNHAFLIRACELMRKRGVRLRCDIAGEGPDRPKLQRLVDHLGLTREVHLLGHVPHRLLPEHYRSAHLVVVTSRSEGIPLCLMEAMAHGRIVLAPAITGIPELVIDGVTGFLYQAGSLEDFVRKSTMIWSRTADWEPIRRAGRQHVIEYFNRRSNLEAFAETFIHRLIGIPEGAIDEAALLQ